MLAALASNQVEGDEGELVDALDRLLGWLDPVWTACYAAVGPACVGLLVAASPSAAWRSHGTSRSPPVWCSASASCWRAVDGAAASSDMLWRVGDPSFRPRGWRSSAPWLWWRRPAHEAGAPGRRRPRRPDCDASLVLGAAYPSQVLGGVGLGLGVGALVRLSFGSSAGFPSIHRVRAALADLGVEGDGLRYAFRPDTGAARYVGDAGGQPLGILVYGTRRTHSFWPEPGGSSGTAIRVHRPRWRASRWSTRP